MKVVAVKINGYWFEADRVKPRINDEGMIVYCEGAKIVYTQILNPLQRTLDKFAVGPLRFDVLRMLTSKRKIPPPKDRINYSSQTKSHNMEQYLGVKLIKGRPLKFSDYCIERSLVKPDNGWLPDREGYYVEYPDGYISWSPKEVFEEAYRRTDGLSFGLAIEAMKKGMLVARSGWNGKGMFLFLRPGDELNISFIIEKVKLLPQSLKDYYKKQDEKEAGSEQGLANIKFGSYICMKAADGTIVNGWLASQTDMLADDWCIVTK